MKVIIKGPGSVRGIRGRVNAIILGFMLPLGIAPRLQPSLVAEPINYKWR